jgi:hypothetical protein
MKNCTSGNDRDGTKRNIFPQGQGHDQTYKTCLHPVGVIPSGSFQANDRRREPSIRCTIREARGKPGQIRRPTPNGISSKSRPL